MNQQDNKQGFSSQPPEANLEIWIADNMCCNCTGHYNWFHKLMAKLLLGWKVINK